MNIKFDNLSDRDFLKHYLNVYNLSMPAHQQLLPSEIDMIIEFALLPEDKFAHQRFSTLAKNKVIESSPH